MTKKYVEGEQFLEVSFELPNVYENLVVSKDNYHVTIYNYKQTSQIIKEKKHGGRTVQRKKVSK